MRMMQKGEINKFCPRQLRSRHATHIEAVRDLEEIGIKELLMSALSRS